MLIIKIVNCAKEICFIPIPSHKTLDGEKWVAFAKSKFEAASKCKKYGEIHCKKEPAQEKDCLAYFGLLEVCSSLEIETHVLAV